MDFIQSLLPVGKIFVPLILNAPNEKYSLWLIGWAITAGRGRDGKMPGCCHNFHKYI